MSFANKCVILHCCEHNTSVRKICNDGVIKMYSALIFIDFVKVKMSQIVEASRF